MNPWHEKLSCEVNVCQAKQCDAERMKICALRKNYLWRVNQLIAKLHRLKRSPFKQDIIDEIKKMGAEKWLKSEPLRQNEQVETG